ncbi:MAG: SpoIIE family protein phosphatase [Gemmataceae bacterium]
MAMLQVLSGPNRGERFSITKERVILGRNPECDVVIAGHAVSREHAQIVRVGNKYFLEDRGSRNGTELNNQPITTRTPLGDADKIKICEVEIGFFESAPPLLPLPPALRREEMEDEESNSTTTLEAAISRLSANQEMHTQPAEKLAALLEISANLSRTLELDSLLPKIADSLFQLFRQADRCFLILQDGNSGRLIPKLIKTRRPNAETSVRFSRSIVKQCLETTEAFLSEDASTDSRFGLSQSIADFRIRSVMCAPLCTVDGNAFGVINLDTQDRSKKFTKDDLKLLVAVANQAAIALENAKLHTDLLARERFQRDLELAREVQRGFLPHRLPDLAGYEFFAHYESAYQVGGDYYDFIPLSQNRLGVMLGDVSGKGVSAALLMAKLSAEGRFCMLTEADPAAAVSRLNDLLLQAGLLDRFVTLATALIDPATHRVTFINAGHMIPLVYRHDQQVLEEAMSNEAGGLPLGVMEGYEYNAAMVQLAPGDSIILYTDGVTDAENTDHQAFGIEGIHNAARGGPFTAARLGERLVQAVKQHSLGRHQFDDLTLVCFGRSSAAAPTT